MTACKKESCCCWNPEWNPWGTEGGGGGSGLVCGWRDGEEATKQPCQTCLAPNIFHVIHSNESWRFASNLSILLTFTFSSFHSKKNKRKLHWKVWAVQNIVEKKLLFLPIIFIFHVITLMNYRVRTDHRGFSKEDDKKEWVSKNLLFSHSLSLSLCLSHLETNYILWYYFGTGHIIKRKDAVSIVNPATIIIINSGRTKNKNKWWTSFPPPPHSSSGLST